MAKIKPQALLIQSKKKKKGPSQISVTTIFLYGSVILIMLFFLFSSYRYWSQRLKIQALNQSSDGSNIEDAKSSDLPRYALLSTSKGLITIELYKDGSPEVVDEFIDLCQRGHFKGMPFHHVIKNFVVQGGNVDGHGAAEDWLLKGRHMIPFDTSLKHEAFMLGTSKDKHDQKEFKLFIMTAPIPDLSDKLIVFGRVIRGEAVVQEIEEVDTDEHYRPKSSIGITDIILKQKV